MILPGIFILFFREKIWYVVCRALAGKAGYCSVHDVELVGHKGPREMSLLTYFLSWATDRPYVGTVMRLVSGL